MPFKDETPMNKKTPYKTGIGICYNKKASHKTTTFSSYNFD